MRILHLGKHYWPSFGGIETALKEMAEAGVRLGHEVEVVVAADPGAGPGPKLAEGLKVRRVRSFGKFLSVPLAPAYLGAPMDAHIIHLHLPNPLAEVRVLAALTRDPSLGRRLAPFLHALPVGHGLLGKLWFRFVTAAIIARSRLLIVSNDSLVRLFPELDRWREKIRVLGFVANDPGMSAHGRGGYVLALGRLVPYKGFDVLLRAHSRIAAGLRPPLWIAGEGPDRPRLEALTAELGLNSTVRFLGEVPDKEKPALLAGAALFVAPSKTSAETFGIAILEAMAAGLAVVTTDLKTGVAELARGGASGAVVPAGDDRALAAAISEMLQDKERLARTGKANREYALQNYGRAALEANYLDLLKRFSDPKGEKIA